MTLNQSESCMEVHRGMWRGVQRGAWSCADVCVEMRGGVHAGVWKCAEGCTEVVTPGNHRFNG